MDSITPVRLQRRRTKGFRLKSPNGLPVVYVGRPTIYGNPFDGLHAADKFRAWWDGRGNPKSVYFKRSTEQMHMLMGAMLQTEPHPLRGKNVVCWCFLCPAHRDGKPLGAACADCWECHGDILLAIAHGDE